MDTATERVSKWRLLLAWFHKVRPHRLLEDEARDRDREAEQLGEKTFAEVHDPDLGHHATVRILSRGPTLTFSWAAPAPDSTPMALDQLNRLEAIPAGQWWLLVAHLADGSHPSIAFSAKLVHRVSAFAVDANRLAAQGTALVTHHEQDQQDLRDEAIALRRQRTNARVAAHDRYEQLRDQRP